MATENRTAESSGLELTITRVFDAPRELVWSAWTDPSHLSRWWGPKGFTCIVWEADLRPGGRYRFGMRSPEGNDIWNRGEYREVVAPRRLVLQGGWTDKDGNPTSPVMTTAITLEQDGGKTRLTLHGAGFESVSARDSHHGGWSSTLDCLADYLASL
jgi:uncharacterized protein YndB with AHSA1/START domain